MKLLLCPSIYDNTTEIPMLFSERYVVIYFIKDDLPTPVQKYELFLTYCMHTK